MFNFRRSKIRTRKDFQVTISLPSYPSPYQVGHCVQKELSFNPMVEYKNRTLVITGAKKKEVSRYTKKVEALVKTEIQRMIDESAFPHPDNAPIWDVPKSFNQSGNTLIIGDSGVGKSDLLNRYIDEAISQRVPAILVDWDSDFNSGDMIYSTSNCESAVLYIRLQEQEKNDVFMNYNNVSQVVTLDLSNVIKDNENKKVQEVFNQTKRVLDFTDIQAHLVSGGVIVLEIGYLYSSTDIAVSLVNAFINHYDRYASTYQSTILFAVDGLQVMKSIRDNEIMIARLVNLHQTTEGRVLLSFASFMLKRLINRLVVQSGYDSDSSEQAIRKMFREVILLSKQSYRLEKDLDIWFQKNEKWWTQFSNYPAFKSVVYDQTTEDVSLFRLNRGNHVTKRG